MDAGRGDRGGERLGISIDVRFLIQTYLFFRTALLEELPDLVSELPDNWSLQDLQVLLP